MILRRVIAHVRNQEWTAVFLDFVIVVVGVFIGIQVSNLNERQEESAHERLLLGELRSELAQSSEQIAIIRNAYNQVSLSGARSVAFLDEGTSCGDACWGVLVDFFHASQWQQPHVVRSAYDEMRRNGWPRNRSIVDAVEDYHRQGTLNANGFRDVPAYRALVRGLIPLAAHSPYWATCYEIKNGEERYLDACPEGVDPSVSAAAVAAIAAHPDIHAALTEWAGYTTGFEATFNDQIASAERAISLIDAELEEAP